MIAGAAIAFGALALIVQFGAAGALAVAALAGVLFLGTVLGGK